MAIIKKIGELKLIPVAVIENPENAFNLGKTLLNAGLPIVEVTFRTEYALDSLLILKKNFPNMLVGAGTVLEIKQVKAASNAGVDFIVSPGFNPKVVDYCLENKILIIPGVNTPTMVEWALERGLNVVKFFPAKLSGGVEMLKALSGPYPEMRFVPTGGINSDNIIAYLKLKNVIACGGSWIVKKDLVNSGKFETIYKLVTNIISLIKSEIK
ncbi:MAG: bifunctional 4-hydroxy-2-oxoglutarate aldolase/2-dehydro-3-deoxy-phosphogluconate aldolase [Candidatus Lokiarchaeia archaeon]|nr:bifunctional 4-hydroxy-2-oxoglutarate aldolase/2-dehydro-3-deoxy-phosphogluconate aldolase [Candidatus Lokiarchaeia archaeon]